MNIRTVCGLLLDACGLSGLAYGFWNLWHALTSPKWPSVNGEIAASCLQRNRDADGMVTYRAGVTYRYQVAGQAHTSDRVFFGDRLAVGWASAAVRRVDKHPPGSVVRVYYDPHQPARAVLEPGNLW